MKVRVRIPKPPRKLLRIANWRERKAALRKKEEHSRPLLNAQYHDPKAQIDLDDLVVRIVVFAQAIAEKRFYPYQVEFGCRIVESVLLHDGDTLTALLSRQSGKTELVGCIMAALAVILPYLARKLPKDWRLNITDD